MARLIVRPRKGWQPLDLRELWSYRELFWVLALRDLKVRYKQTFLGVVWAVAQPLSTMLVFTMIGGFGKIPTDGAPPAVFYYTSTLPWFLFANSVTSAGHSLGGSQHLVTKVYFPRLIVPTAAVLTTLVDFCVSFSLLVLMLLWGGIGFQPQIALLPLVVLLTAMAAMAFGIWLSALNARFRDVRYVMPFLIQLWLFATPVLYPASVVQTPWKRILLAVNPMSGLIDAFRWCVLGRPAPGYPLLISAGVILAVFVTALFFFRRLETSLVDRL